MSRVYRYAGVSLVGLAGVAMSNKVYAKEPAKGPRVWMIGNKHAIPNGSLVDLERPTPISWFDKISVGWKQITTGPHFGCAVTSTGVLYMWGYDVEKNEYMSPKIFMSAKKFTNVTTTENHVVALGKDGSVCIIDPLTCTLVAELRGPSSWLGRTRFVAVSAGRRHVAMIDSEGNVWTAGDNSFGQCGRPQPKRDQRLSRFDFYDQQKEDDKIDFAKSLTCVLSEKNSAQVVCGGRHTVVINRSGKPISFGDDSRIQLGLGDTRSQDMPDYVPHSGMGRLDADGMAPDMSKLFQSTTGAVKYTFYDRHTRHKPTDMKLPVDVEATSGAVLGDNFTILTVGDSGMMLACGENQLGQCGRGLNKQQQTFASVKLPKQVKPTQVSCGLAHCVASLEDGSVYTWGGNAKGQLGVGNRAPACPPVLVHRSKIRGPLMEDIITRIGQAPETSAEEIQEFLEERERDSIKVDKMLTKAMTIPQPPPESVDRVSKIKQLLLDAIDRSRAELMMNAEEQSKWAPVFVNAGYNNTVIVLKQTESP